MRLNSPQTVMSSKHCEVREKTLLSREILASRSEFLDWDTQPSIFKHYPHFCYRISLSKLPQLAWLRDLRSITERTQIGTKPYYRLNVPSAGNLHPIEIYVQIRNIDGILSGIYHWDVVNEELIMIEEIASNGFEPYLGMDQRFNGCLLFMTLVPYRSFWKYGLRSWRYLYLDLGHQIGALHGSLRQVGITPTKLSTIDYQSLQNFLGLGEDEVLGAVYALGHRSEKKVKALTSSLMYVSPCDYLKRDEKIKHSLSNPPYTAHLPFIGEHFDRQSNILRRSARAFDPQNINDAWCRRIFAVEVPSGLQVIHIVFRAHSMQLGVYKNGQCIEEGNFVAEIVHLLLDQRFIAHASMVSLIFSEQFSATAHIESGMLAHEYYCLAEQMNAGCSGIGAFFDDEAKRWCDKLLLYAVAIGGRDDYRSTKRD